MTRKRIIVCLDVRDGRLSTTASVAGLSDAADIPELAAHYQAEGADAVLLLDAAPSPATRSTLLDLVRRTADRLRIPLVVTGGIHSLDDIEAALAAGAAKVGLNTAAAQQPELVTGAASRFGNEAVVACIDTRIERRAAEQESPPAAAAAASMLVEPERWYRVFTHGGRSATALEAVAWARRCAELGAGEILLNSIDREERRAGYDLELTARVAEAVGVPVIASGGAASAEHVRDAFLLAGADAALVADVFHDGTTTIAEVKRLLAEPGNLVPPA